MLCLQYYQESKCDDLTFKQCGKLCAIVMRDQSERLFCFILCFEDNRSHSLLPLLHSSHIDIKAYLMLVADAHKMGKLILNAC